MGLFFKRSVQPCPNCGVGFYVDAGMLADDHRYRCESCGSMLYIEMCWDKVKSISCVSPASEAHKGYGGVSTPKSKRNSDEDRIGNVEYWKKEYGVNWLEAHDEWECKDNEWWDKRRNEVK